MYSRFASLLSIAALAAVVAGAPNALDARNGGTSQCNTGSLQCCNSITTASNPVTSVLLDLFGVNSGTVTGTVGLTCSGNSGSSTTCTQEPVCCNGNTFNGGLVVIGCSPLTL